MALTHLRGGEGEWSCFSQKGRIRFIRHPRNPYCRGYLGHSGGGHSPDEMVIYNLSDDVLEVSSAQFGVQPEITAQYREPDGLLPEPGDMEIYMRRIRPSLTCSRETAPRCYPWAVMWSLPRPSRCC
jgi:hypothetical protein